MPHAFMRYPDGQEITRREQEDRDERNGNNRDGGCLACLGFAILLIALCITLMAANTQANNSGPPEIWIALVIELFSLGVLILSLPVSCCFTLTNLWYYVNKTYFIACYLNIIPTIWCWTERSRLSHSDWTVIGFLWVCFIRSIICGMMGLAMLADTVYNWCGQLSDRTHVATETTALHDTQL